MRYAPLAILFAGLAGCMAPVSPAQRLSDTAYEMSTAMRFGRMDIAADTVRPEARAEFAKSHAAWGRSIRIVEVELAGLMLHEKDEAEVIVNVSWQRANEADVRMTAVAQTWKDDRGWKIVAEERRGGDTGLLGEPTEAAAPGAVQERFVTRVIRAD